MRVAAPGRGLRLRLGVGSALAAGGISAAIALGCLALLSATLNDALDIELDAAQRDAADAFAAERDRVVAGLAEVEERLRGVEQASFERLLRGLPGPDDLATRLSGSTGLDRLEVLDPDGVVLVGGADRLGLRDPGLLDLPSGHGRLVRDRARSRGALSALAARRIAVGSRALTLVGGRRLDGRVLARLRAGDSALLLAPSGGPVRVAAGGESAGAAALTAWVGRGGSRDERFAGPAGRRWQARLVPLSNPDEPPVGYLVVATDRTALDGRLARLRGAFFALTAGAALLAGLFGVHLAKRATRPLAQLTREVDAIAAGRADYTFAGATRDEFGELAAAFSRMHRSLESQRRRSLAAERVAAWSEVARHVAHEVKNPLVPIRLTVENLQRARKSGHAGFDRMFEEGMTTIQEEVAQLARLVGEFSEFARLPPPSRRAVDLAGLLDAALDLWDAEPDLAVERCYAADLPRVELDPDQIARAFKNVIGNAVEAMREGGDGPRRLTVRASAEADAVVVEFADSGPGLTDESARRMFEPYFTTKPEGTGLGMAITYRILVEHGGAISAENRREGGASVTIILPRSAERLPRVAGGGPS